MCWRVISTQVADWTRILANVQWSTQVLLDINLVVEDFVGRCGSHVASQHSLMLCCLHAICPACWEPTAVLSLWHWPNLSQVFLMSPCCWRWSARCKLPLCQCFCHPSTSLPKGCYWLTSSCARSALGLGFGRLIFYAWHI